MRIIEGSVLWQAADMGWLLWCPVVCGQGCAQMQGPSQPWQPHNRQLEDVEVTVRWPYFNKSMRVSACGDVGQRPIIHYGLRIHTVRFYIPGFFL